MSQIFVKAHRRGKSLVRSYQRADRGAINTIARPKKRARFKAAIAVRNRAAKGLRKKIEIGNILLNRRIDPGMVMGLISYRGTRGRKRK